MGQDSDYRQERMKIKRRDRPRDSERRGNFVVREQLLKGAHIGSALKLPAPFLGGIWITSERQGR